MATRVVDLGLVVGPAGRDGVGKKTARFVVGTSAAGWTAADCDYLCDGTADQSEINAAIAALPNSGGEVVILDGTYNLSGTVTLNKANVTLRGCGAASMLSSVSARADVDLVTMTADRCTVADLGFEAWGSSGLAIKADNCKGGKIAGNTILAHHGGEVVFCIWLTATASNMTVSNNYMPYGNGSDKSGIRVLGNSNVVSGNIVDRGEDGIAVSGRDNAVVGNVACGDFSGEAYSIGSNNADVGNMPAGR